MPSDPLEWHLSNIRTRNWPGVRLHAFAFEIESSIILRYFFEYLSISPQSSKHFAGVLGEQMAMSESVTAESTLRCPPTVYSALMGTSSPGPGVTMFVRKVQASGSICGITPQGGGDRADTLERELHHIFYVISGERHSNTAVFSSCLAKVTGRLSAISGPANTAESQAPPFELSSNEASRLQASSFKVRARNQIPDYLGLLGLVEFPRPLHSP